MHTNPMKVRPVASIHDQIILNSVCFLMLQAIDTTLCSPFWTHLVIDLVATIIWCWGCQCNNKDVEHCLLGDVENQLCSVLRFVFLSFWPPLLWGAITFSFLILFWRFFSVSDVPRGVPVLLGCLKQRTLPLDLACPGWVFTHRPFYPTME
jgi:hypothetical protein